MSGINKKTIRRTNYIRKFFVIILGILLFTSFLLEVIPTKEVFAAQNFTQVKAVGTVDQDYKYDPQANEVVLKFNIKWWGLPENSTQYQLIRKGDLVKVQGGSINEYVPVNRISVGVAPLAQTVTDWGCGANKACNISRVDIDNSASQVTTWRLDPKLLGANRAGVQHYKYVPILTLEELIGFQDTNESNDRFSLIEFVADSGSGFSFTVDWVSGYAGNNYLARTNPAQVEQVGAQFLTAIDENLSIKNRVPNLVTVLTNIISIILNVIFGIVDFLLGLLFSMILLPIINALLGGNENFIAAKIPAFVQEGWIYTRDGVNLGFILVLIYAAIATMLNVEGYGLKKTIGRVVVIALVINFSLLAGQILLNFAQILTKAFIDPEAIHKIFNEVYIFSQAGPREWWASNVADSTKSVGILMFAIIYELGVFIVLGALAALLVVRLVAVWTLLIIAPAAYVAYMVTQGQSFLKKWWTQFLCWCFFAPIMGFFLALTVKLVNSKNFFQVSTGAASGSFGDTIAAVLQGVIVLIFLVISLRISRIMGCYGADLVTANAEKLWKGAASWTAGAPIRGGAFLAKRGAGRLGRAWNDWTTGLLKQKEGERPPGKLRKAAFAVLNPVNFARGWDQRSQELKKMSQEMAAAGGREVAEQFLTRGKLKIPYRQFVNRKHENEFLKEYGEMSKEQLMSLAVDLDSMKGHEADIRRIAVVKAAVANGFMDDLMRMKEFANQYADQDGTIYSAEVLNKFLFGFLKSRDTGKIDETAMRFIDEDMEELGKKSKHYEYLGHAYYDPEDRVFKRGMKVDKVKIKRGKDEAGNDILVDGEVVTENFHQAGYAAGEFNKIGGRERIGAAPHNFMSIRAEIDEDGKFLAKGKEIGGEEKDKTFYGSASGKLTTAQEEMVKRMDIDVIREAQHAQGRLVNWILSADFQDGKFVARDVGEYDRMREVFRINPDLVRALYAKKLDQDPRAAITRFHDDERASKAKGDTKYKDNLLYSIEVAGPPGTGFPPINDDTVKSDKKPPKEDLGTSE